MDWPSHLLERAIRQPDLELGIVPGSTPVVAFGDPVEAWVATLGINPSRAEFLDTADALLDGPDRRLATLPSLGVERYEDLTREHARVIVDDCASYFDRRPYAWFAPLGEVMGQALGVSYAERTACHLDLVQWATRALWGELSAEDQAELERQDVGFLRRQLTSPGHRVVIVNGRNAMRSVERNGLLRWRSVDTLAGPPAAQFAVGTSGDTTFLGWTCDLQSQHGAGRHVGQLADLVARHGPTPRRGRVGSAPGTTARRAAPATPVTQATVQASASAADAARGGPIPKGLHFTSKSELVSYLAAWLDGSSYGTIGEVGTYGGSAWCTVDSEAGQININRDTTRDAAEALVAASRAPCSYDWLVVANQKGRVNRVLFCEDRTPGWYAYLVEPLDAETPLGRRPGTEPARGSSARRAAIVHFPHPGGEHVPRGTYMGWNRGTHARKFLSGPGTYIDGDGVAQDDDVVFWGEWEAPSRVVHRWAHRADLPTVVHEPYWATFDVERGGHASCQNTDPWVFGDTFLYSNCRQLTPTRKPSAMQRLPAGSLILFGSTLRGEFVLDTVFVIGEVAGTYTSLAPPQDLGVDEAFTACTLNPLATLDDSYTTATFTLFRGATPASPIAGTYSFVPCLPRTDPGARFPRPVVRLPGVVNPRSTQSASGAGDLRPADEVVDVWHDIVDQVRNAGLDLAVHLATPPRGTA